MTTINVQFSDATEAAIISVFGCPQDPAVWPNQGAIPSNDARYSTWYSGLPTWYRTGLIAPGS